MKIRAQFTLYLINIEKVSGAVYKKSSFGRSSRMPAHTTRRRVATRQSADAAVVTNRHPIWGPGTSEVQ